MLRLIYLLLGLWTATQTTFAALELSFDRFTLNNTTNPLFLRPGETFKLAATLAVKNENATGLGFELNIPPSGFNYLGGAATEVFWVSEITDIPLTKFNPPHDKTAPLTNSGTARTGDHLDIFNINLQITPAAQNFENTFTARFFSSTTNSPTRERKIFLDIAPHILTAKLSKTTLLNNNLDTTNLTVTVQDYNGCSNLDTATVTANLSALGGDPQTALTFLSCTANQARFQKNNLQTSAAAGRQEIPLTATDENGNRTNPTDSHFGLNDLSKIAINIANPKSPQVHNLTASDTLIGGATQQTTTLTWQNLNGGLANKIMLGYSFDCSAGTTLQDWQTGSQSYSLAASQLNPGLNIITVCTATTAPRTIGSNFLEITKDTTPATLTKISVTPIHTTYQDISFRWQANERGTYTTSLNAESESAPTIYPNIRAKINNRFLNRDLLTNKNTLRLHFTDEAGNRSSLTNSVFKTYSPPPLAWLTLTDEDNTQEGIDGRDFTVRWGTPKYSYIESFLIYILPSNITLAHFIANQNLYVESKILSEPQATSWTGPPILQRDSPGNLLEKSEYQVFVVLLSLSGERSTVIPSNIIQINSEDFTAPTVTSLIFDSTQKTFQIDWSEPMQAKVPTEADFSITNGNLGSNPDFQWASPQTLLIKLAADSTIFTNTLLQFTTQAQKTFCDFANNCLNSALPTLQHDILNLPPVITEFRLSGLNSFFNTLKIPIASLLASDPEKKPLRYAITENAVTPKLADFQPTLPSTYQLKNKLPGEHQLFAWALDQQNRISTTKKVSLTLDQTPPSQLTTNPTAGHYTSTQNITLTCTDTLIGVAEIRYGLNGLAPTQLYTNPLPLNQNTTLNLKCLDRAGNSLSKTATYTFQLETSSSSGPGWFPVSAKPVIKAITKTLDFSQANGLVATELIQSPATQPDLTLNWPPATQIQKSNGAPFQGLIYPPQIVSLKNTIHQGEELTPLLGVKLSADTAGLQFSKPLRLTLPLPTKNPVRTQHFNIYRYNPATTTYNRIQQGLKTTADQISVAINQLGVYALFANNTLNIAFNPPIPHATALRFPDVQPGTWFFNPVNKLAEQGFLKGYHDGTFRPWQPITRGELISVAVKLYNLKLPTKITHPPFRDIKLEDYFALPAAAAKKANWLKGYPDNTFRPHNPITRAEAIKILTYHQNPPEPTPTTKTFRDISPTAWYFQFIHFATQQNLITGYPDNTFKPHHPLSRAEFAVIAARLLKNQ